jgi:hypothetical protein
VRTVKFVGNVVILAARAVLMGGAAIAVAILLVYGFAVVTVRRIELQPTLTAGA